uniref:Uncharacterized protein n=1 Tax=Glossina brevipalpis TaxID=37001 RepID=A0A1A9WQ73_9MUSC
MRWKRPSQCPTQEAFLTQHTSTKIVVRKIPFQGKRKEMQHILKAWHLPRLSWEACMLRPSRGAPALTEHDGSGKENSAVTRTMLRDESHYVCASSILVAPYMEKEKTITIIIYKINPLENATFGPAKEIPSWEQRRMKLSLQHSRERLAQHARD